MTPVLDARSVAAALGGDVVGRDAVQAPGPGHTAKDRSLAIKIDASAPDGLLVFSHSGDDWKLCRDHVRRRLGLPEWQPGDEQQRAIPSRHVQKWDLAMIDAEANDRRRTEDDHVRIKRAVELWNAAGEPRDTLAERYLRLRYLELGDDLGGRVLRFHPRCPWRDENTGRTIYVPALIAAFRSVDDDAITAIHRIAINKDGTKLGRRMLGVVQRAAVKLDLAPVNGSLAIGEGIETCMAARQLGVAPTWAVGSTGSITFFPLLAGVTTLRIIGENDSASEKALMTCGRRWRRDNRRVRVIRPPAGSKDINDAIIAEAHHARAG
jgi:putative DNA primase/helicase